jgi:hypothetical protein
VKRLFTIHPNNTSFLCRLYRALCYNYTTHINEIHTLQINALIRFLTSSTFFKTHGFIIRQTVCSRSLCMACFSYIYASSLAGRRVCSHTICYLEQCGRTHSTTWNSVFAHTLPPGTVCSHTLFHLLDWLSITTTYVVINKIYSCVLNFECYDCHCIYVYWLWYFSSLTFYVFVLCVLTTWGWPLKLVIVYVTIFNTSVCILLIAFAYEYNRNDGVDISLEQKIVVYVCLRIFLNHIAILMEVCPVRYI